MTSYDCECNIDYFHRKYCFGCDKEHNCGEIICYDCCSYMCKKCKNANMKCECYIKKCIICLKEIDTDIIHYACEMCDRWVCENPICSLENNKISRCDSCYEYYKDKIEKK